MNSRKILGFALGPLGTGLLGLLTVPLTTWIFTPEDVGRLYLLQIVVTLSVLALSLGLDQAYVREFHGADNHPQLVRSSFLPGLIFFAIIAVIGAIFAKQLSWLIFGVADPLYLWLTIVCVFAAYVSRPLSLILRMHEKALAYSLSQVVPRALFVVLIGFVALTRLPAEFVQLELSLTISTVVVMLVYLWMTRQEWTPALRASIDPERFRALLKFSIPLFFASLAYWGLSATSAVVLRALSTFHEVGIYSVSMSIAGVAGIFQAIFSVVWAPIVYKWVATGANMSRVDMVGRQALAVVCGIFVAMGTLSWLLDFVLPTEYINVKYLVLCSIVQPLLYTLSEVTGIGISITRRTIMSLWATLAALVVNVGLCILLIPSHGATGAVIANALSFLIFFIGRTEFSAFVWRQFSRIRQYSVVGAALLLSVMTATLGPNTGALFSFVWLAAAPITLWVFRDEARAIVRLLRRELRLRKGLEWS